MELRMIFESIGLNSLELRMFYIAINLFKEWRVLK